MTELPEHGFRAEDMSDLEGRFASILDATARAKTISRPLRELPPSTPLGSMYRSLLIQRLSLLERQELGPLERASALRVEIEGVEERIRIMESFQHDLAERLALQGQPHSEALDEATETQHRRIERLAFEDHNEALAAFIQDTRTGFAVLLES